MTANATSTPVKALLLDAGGVLVTPPLALHAGMAGIDVEEAIRLFYKTYAETSLVIENDMADCWRNYAENLGLPARSFERGSCDPALLHWNSPISGVVGVLEQAKALGIKVAVISNAGGDVDHLLDEAGVCHVGAHGNGVQIDAIFDSGDVTRYPDERISRKPNATMLIDACNEFAIEPDEALFIGDAIWADALAAFRWGGPFLHMDPFGDCADTSFAPLDLTLLTDGHDHLAKLSEVIPFIAGERSRRSVHA